MNIKKKFGNRLKHVRLSLNLTQEELAEKINMSSKSLSQIELGNNFISSETLNLLCQALNIKPKVLFDFDCFESSKDSIIEDINERLKNNPEMLQILYKIIVAIDS